MALLTQSQINDVTKLAVTMFGAAPGAYKDFLQEVYVANGTDLQATANAYANEPAFSTMFTGTNEDKADMLMERFGIEQSDMENGQPVGQAAYDFFLASLNNGESVQDIIAVTIPYIYEDPNFSVYATILDNKVAVANAFTNGNGAAVTDLSVLQTVVAGVNENTDTGGLVTASLTTGQDNVFGTAANDIFAANLSANADTLQSGDYINGGAGIDTLNATVAFTPYAITPQTESVEILNVRSQSDLGDGAGDNEVEDHGVAGAANTIDAQDMNGTREFWNTDSRADLAIEDVRHDSHQTTIGWRQTDAGTDETSVDYGVYFDHDHITSPDGATIGGTLTLTVADLDLLDTTVQPANPGNGDPFDSSFPYDILNINFDGVDYDLNIDYTNVTDWTDLAAEINVALANAGLANLQAGVSGSTNVIHPVTGNNLNVEQIVISKIDASAPGNFDAAASTWDTTGSVPGDTAYLTRIQDEQAIQKPSLTQVDIVLDHVGRGEKAGVLEIGNISNIDNNTHAYSKGIEQFNVEVDRDSYFGILKSTSNGVQNVETSLEVVNVVNIAENSDGTGDLRIDGFGTTDGLTDVRVFDASDMVGNATITASLTEEVVAKYMDRQDDQADPADDNSDPVDYLDVVDTYFSYDFGSGNDTLSLAVSDANLAAAGTTSREDFELEINGNDGDDSITFAITGTGTTSGALADDNDGAANWYINHQQNANIVINTGNGDDTVMTPGAGDLTITTGNGNDTVYTDNTGDKATWVVNATNTDTTDLQSEVLTDHLIYKSQLTVTFSGGQVSIPGAGGSTGVTGVAGNSVAFANGFERTVTVPTDQYLGSQAELNQAIKEAINTDEVLSKLIVAQDGPSNTLVITSLVDGEFGAEDLNFDLAAATLADLTVGEQTALQTAWEELNADSTLTLTQADLNTEASDIMTHTGYDASVLATGGAGTAGTYASDNTINAGANNDVIVLSTTNDDTGAAGSSNETVVFTNYNQGEVTVFNFDDGNGANVFGQDVIDFTYYLTNVESASGSVTSQVRIATGSQLEDLSDGVTVDVDANEVVQAVSFAAVGTETWANMTANDFLSAIQNNTDSYGNIGDADIDVVAASAYNLVGTDIKSIMMVENSANLGEYKVFEVTGTVGGDFTSANLVGVVDFGTSVDFTTGTGIDSLA